MKKTLKVLLIITLSMLITILAFITYYYAITSLAHLYDEKLINLDRTTTFFDANGEKIIEESGGISVTDLSELNDYTYNAFISIEDKRFYIHNGIDYKRLLSATFNNIKSLSFKEGASTISQQLIKNTHLSNEKTINRKLKEIKLAKELERKYSKKQILEKYLNTIYFGDNCYGITSAAKHYFNKEAKNLSINESAALAGVIKSPANYSPYKNIDKCNKRKNLVLKAMLEQNYISESEYKNNKNEDIIINKSSEIKDYDYYYLVKNELSNIEQNSPYAAMNINVYTSYDKFAQKILEKQLKNIEKSYLKSAILLDKKSNILAYYSNCGNIPRQLGSTIKPILVYAPAIEENIVSSYSHIIDEQVNFNGYSPSNYNDKYYGKVTVQDSLAKSLNSCAVKLLNCVGIDKALSYAKKTDLNFTDNDTSLCLALGSSEQGQKLSSITAAYTTFINNGNYSSPTTIKNLTYNSRKIQPNNIKNNQIFTNETTSILNQMLKNTVENGTAKKLSYLPFPIYAKTGTVGNEKGNTDAYTISYSEDYVLGCWVGNMKNDLLPNSITGGSLPTLVSYNIWEEIYQNKRYPEEIRSSSNLTEVYIDKISYEKDDTIIIADENAPQRYKEKILIKKSNLPSIVSTRFTSPKIETSKISINNNGFNIVLCLPEYYCAEIYREDKKKILIKTLCGNDSMDFTDTNIKKGNTYQYSVIPFFISSNDKKYYGEEIILPKIKIPETFVSGDDWWNNCD